MKKSDLIVAMAKVSGINQIQATTIVNRVARELSEVATHNKEVRIPKLGTFKPSIRTSRPVRNFNTGKVIQLPGRRVVAFVPSEFIRPNIIDTYLASKDQA